MSKRLSITIADYVYDTYLSTPTKNLSQRIEQLIIVGSEALLNKDKINKSHIIKLGTKIQSLESDNKKLKSQVEHYKTILNKKRK